MHLTRITRRHRGIMLVEMLCVMGLFCTIMVIVSPLLRDLMLNIPRAQHIVNEQNTFIGRLTELRSMIEAAESISLCPGRAVLHNADGSTRELTVQDDMLSCTVCSLGGQPEQAVKDVFAYTQPQLTLFPLGSDKPQALKLQLSVITHRQPSEHLSEPLNVLFYLKEGQYVSN